MTEQLKNNNKLGGHRNMGIFSTSLINTKSEPSNPTFLKAGSSKSSGSFKQVFFLAFLFFGHTMWHVGS